MTRSRGESWVTDGMENWWQDRKCKKLNMTELCIEKDGWGKGQSAKRYYHYPLQTVPANSLALLFCSDTECSPFVSLRNMLVLTSQITDFGNPVSFRKSTDSLRDLHGFRVKEVPLPCLWYHQVGTNNIHCPVSCKHLVGAVVWEISHSSLFFHLRFHVYSAILGVLSYEYWGLCWERYFIRWIKF